MSFQTVLPQGLGPPIRSSEREIERQSCFLSFPIKPQLAASSYESSSCHRIKACGIRHVSSPTPRSSPILDDSILESHAPSSGTERMQAILPTT